MTLLELVQRLADESGTGSGATISTVVSQTGRKALFVQWVQSAYEDIQNRESAWRWLEAEWAGQTVVGQNSYTFVDLGIPDRFAEWIYGDEYQAPVTIYLTSEGAAGEYRLIWRDWVNFRSVYRIGVAPQVKPSVYAVAPDNQIHVYGTPDAVYTLRGRYRKAPQSLAADGDIPEMPERFHSLIVDRALDYLGVFDESPGQVPAWSLRAISKMNTLMRDQLPRVTMGGFFA